MFKHPFFIFLFCVLALIGILHALGITFSLYWRLLYFDKIVHTLGGIWVSGMALWFVFLSGLFLYKDFRETHRALFYWIGLLAACVVGIGWEVFEFIIYGPLLAGGMQPYFIDTAGDLVSDIGGALIITGYFVSHRLYSFQV